MKKSNEETLLSVLSTMSELMRATGRYVHRRLEGKDAKAAYKLAMSECINNIHTGWLDLNIVKSKIEGVRSEANHLYKDGFFSSKKAERQAHMLAVDHSLEIVNKLETRFITGGSSTSVKRPHNDGDTYYEDKSFC